MKIRDRVKELRKVKASELRPHPLNPRTHDLSQRRAMRGLLEELGFAGACFVVETPGGLLTLDGHMRAELAGDQEVSCVVLDLDDEEARKFLASYDPVGAMAGRDDERMRELLDGIDATDRDFAALVDQLREEVAEPESKGRVENLLPGPLPTMAWVLLGIPLDEFGAARPHVVALEQLAKIKVEVTRGPQDE